MLMIMCMVDIKLESQLGKESIYIDQYNSDLLFPIPRAEKRKEIGISDKPPFFGCDVWNAYELSWLRNDGRPEVATAEIIYPCESEFIVESKSLKLYLNSFNSTFFQSHAHVLDTIKRDLSVVLRSEVEVIINNLDKKVSYMMPPGINIDNFYDKDNGTSQLMILKGVHVEKEQLFTNLLKSNCPVTMQPDWATLMIAYTGQKIDYTSLLNYVIALRNLNEFHEQCVEKIYVDIHKACKPEYLRVYARYTRRGGIDINPYRCSEKLLSLENYRVCRQ
jgi:7-cyano-7-deazaguanine reductase